MIHPTQKIRIFGQQLVDMLTVLVPHLPRDGSIECVIRDFKKNATEEQRGLMWVRIGEIAEQGYLQGKRFSAAAWHEQFKEWYLPEEYTEGITKDGYQKWVETPKGARRLIGSTEMLTAKGKALHVLQIEAFGASELGVRFSVRPERKAA
jgi:hypothetical protein